MQIVRYILKASEPIGAPFPCVIFHFVGYSMDEAVEIMGNKYAGFASSMVVQFRHEVFDILVQSDSMGIIETKAGANSGLFVCSVAVF